MSRYPQVGLFGSLNGDWREQVVIPLLRELGVSYYIPISENDWTPELGRHEADLMAHCETLVMVFNLTSPAFTALAESGWAALGAVRRGQHFILYIDPDFTLELPDSLRHTPDGQQVEQLLQHWAISSRHLVYHHAKQFRLNRLHVVEDMQGVVAHLREIYME